MIDISPGGRDLSSPGDSLYKNTGGHKEKIDPQSKIE
jgi:hypothetical protein